MSFSRIAHFEPLNSRVVPARRLGLTVAASHGQSTSRAQLLDAAKVLFDQSESAHRAAVADATSSAEPTRLTVVIESAQGLAASKVSKGSGAHVVYASVEVSGKEQYSVLLSDLTNPTFHARFVFDPVKPDDAVSIGTSELQKRSARSTVSGVLTLELGLHQSAASLRPPEQRSRSNSRSGLVLSTNVQQAVVALVQTLHAQVDIGLSHPTLALLDLLCDVDALPHAAWQLFLLEQLLDQASVHHTALVPLLESFAADTLFSDKAKRGPGMELKFPPVMERELLPLHRAIRLAALALQELEVLGRQPFANAIKQLSAQTQLETIVGGWVSLLSASLRNYQLVLSPTLAPPGASIDGGDMRTSPILTVALEIIRRALQLKNNGPDHALDALVLDTCTIPLREAKQLLAARITRVLAEDAERQEKASSARRSSHFAHASAAALLASSRMLLLDLQRDSLMYQTVFEQALGINIVALTIANACPAHAAEVEGFCMSSNPDILLDKSSVQLFSTLRELHVITEHARGASSCQTPMTLTLAHGHPAASTALGTLPYARHEQWISAFILAWLDSLRFKMKDWVKQALAHDRFSAVSDTHLHSSSVVDVFGGLTQATDTLSDLRWPDERMMQQVFLKLAEIVTTQITMYSELLVQNEVIGEHSPHGYVRAASGSDASMELGITSVLCVAMNNVIQAFDEMTTLREVLAAHILNPSSSAEDPVASLKPQNETNPFSFIFSEMIAETSRSLNKSLESLMRHVTTSVATGVHMHLIAMLQLLEPGAASPALTGAASNQAPLPTAVRIVSHTPACYKQADDSEAPPLQHRRTPSLDAKASHDKRSSSSGRSVAKRAVQLAKSIDWGRKRDRAAALRISQNELEAVVTPLVDFLDGTLQALTASIYQDVFRHLLQQIWLATLQAFEHVLQPDARTTSPELSAAPGKNKQPQQQQQQLQQQLQQQQQQQHSPEVTAAASGLKPKSVRKLTLRQWKALSGTLNTLLEFFNADGDGLATSVLKSARLLDLQAFVQLEATPSPMLMHEYLKQQHGKPRTLLDIPRSGSLKVDVLLRQETSTGKIVVVVDHIHGVALPSLDASGVVNAQVQACLVGAKMPDEVAEAIVGHQLPAEATLVGTEPNRLARTSVSLKSTDVYFPETLEIATTREELTQSNLSLSVWHHPLSRLGSSCAFLGEMVVSGQFLTESLSSPQAAGTPSSSQQQPPARPPPPRAQAPGRPPPPHVTSASASASANVPPSSRSNWKIHESLLPKETASGKRALQVLASRKSDALAQEFVRQRKGAVLSHTETTSAHGRASSAAASSLAASSSALSFSHNSKVHLVNNHMFRATHFNSLPQCKLCTKLLVGIGKQGYRCERCGAVCHKQCHETLPACAI
ncbi:hypothetical protein CAOG_001678 [Capsaspora owczarzaki ATCC 30864]|uniref:Phorbol-ester/DAG-type domain-containing protein n=1 Tax=Capsaspora owczarzaki (strain ATCC 30864) TaxID=595528 RepID=A0A0D2WJQ2_CAPO3|nr:hypothetical protein CAOG_001678 [Capsaspora owczarzaki ATCC 30864]